MLGINEPFLAELVPVVVGVMEDAYPELQEKQEFIMSVLTQDEEKFLITLESGQAKSSEIIHDLKREGQSEIPGSQAFMLYDTFGFPLT